MAVRPPSGLTTTSASAINIAPTLDDKADICRNAIDLWRVMTRDATAPKVAILAATGVILSATYMLWMFQRVNYGTVTNPKNEKLPDLQTREWVVLVPIIAMCLVMGIFPNVFLRPLAPAVDKLLTRMNQATRVTVQSAPPAAPVLAAVAEKR